MMLLYKNTLIKIKRSLGRFISLFMIMLVGVGFFAGIRESTPDIIHSLSQYANSQNLMDFEIVSTMGLTDDDVGALTSLKNISAVTPSYSLDVLSHGKTVRVQAIEKSVNTVKLIKGRMPENGTECLADDRYYKLGDKIDITSNVSGKLKNTTYTVSGTVKSSLYMSSDYGNTTVGDGKLYSFLFVNRSNFTLQAYTQVYLTVTGTKNVAAFSKGYENITSKVNDELVDLKPERENARYHEIYDKANQELQGNENKLNSEKSKGEKALDDAKAQLDASAVQLNHAKSDLEQDESALQNQIIARNKEFQAAKAQIADGWEQIDEALQQNGIARNQLGDKIDQLNSAIQSFKEQQSELAAGNEEYAQIGAQIQQYSAAYQGLLKLQASAQSLSAQEDKLNQGIETLDAQAALAKKKLDDGKNELAENQKKLDNGYAEYSKSLNDFHAKMADAQAKIQDGKTELSDISKPKWTILDRNDEVNGYNDLKSAMNTINLIAAILPLFFLLIVALMTSNTMARMIAEERGELGTLASLGFNDGIIVSTYLLYVMLATVLGTVFGYFLGCTIIPRIIYTCFPYILPPLGIRYNVAALLFILAAAIALMSAVTVIACRHELKEEPAALMRPVPPKNGKTILLERVNFIWKHLSFTWKVTMRNIFRYKQRVFMTVIGIACCTALLLAGFGIKDSIDGVAQKQYQNIFTYQDLLVLKNETRNMSGELSTLFTKEYIQNPLLLRQTALTCESREKTLDAYLVVPENENQFYQFFKLQSTRNGSAIRLNDDGVVVSQKIAEAYNLAGGSTLTVKDPDGNSYTLTVLDVTENYIQNYIYMSSHLYSKVFGKSISYNMIVSDHSGDEDSIANHLLASGQIVSVNFTDHILQQAMKQNGSLNSVVLLLICIASMLAIIVLYNLTSINISERKREIATLKVLGFRDGETNEYIYREAFILTLISIGIGLFLGIGLHHYVMDMIERDEVLYFKNIKAFSFLWTFLITMIFTLIMQTVTYFNLKKINMIESLKSVE